MMSNQPGIQVEATVYFSTNLKTLAKRYRNIRKDVQPLLDQLAAGQVLGEQVPNVGIQFIKCGYLIGIVSGENEGVTVCCTICVQRLRFYSSPFTQNQIKGILPQQQFEKLSLSIKPIPKNRFCT